MKLRGWRQSKPPLPSLAMAGRWRRCCFTVKVDTYQKQLVASTQTWGISRLERCRNSGWYHANVKKRLLFTALSKRVPFALSFAHFVRYPAEKSMAIVSAYTRVRVERRAPRRVC